MAQQLAIGVDLGGTTVKTGLISADGNILATSKLPTRADENPQAVIEQIKKSVSEVLKSTNGATVAGIGIGAPGLIQNPGGIVKNPPNLKGWDVVPLADEIAKEFKMRVEVDNDANVAAVAEAKFGAGKDYPNFLFIIWGTGVGGGVIMNNQIYRGPSGGAGEVGHISINYEGLLCNCGTRGCVEAYIGQKYLSNRTIEKLRANPNSKIMEVVGGDLDKVAPVYISKAAEMGDKLATDILVEAGTLLGVMIGGVMNTLDFRLTVIGGGVSAVGNFVYNAITESVKKNVQKPLRDGIKVIRAELGNDAGIFGAAGMVL
ncbi:MAG: ROK family protein [Ignavibacteriales bacterium]|nr:ROK family protein [Ignavibacteriales bacterium]